ncbi:MAG: hypothetical protein VKP70_10185 [Cyanobacteriota bacterium]|nr:hypothetical protein [Cyanobacteriota bacterium]
MVNSQTLGGDSEREGERDRRLRHRICQLLDVGSLCLFAIFLVQLLPLIIESKPMQPLWQGQFVEVTLNQSLLAFVGFVLLHLAVLLHPNKQPLRARLRQVRHLAVIATVAFLLLIPLQLASSYQEFRAERQWQQQQAAEATRVIELRDWFSRATTTKEIDLRLQAGARTGLSPEQLKMPLPQLQEELLKAAYQRQATLKPIERPLAGGLSPLMLLLKRVGGAVGWALAFSAGAVPWGTKTTLFERLQRR